jgi:hypothetical protein
MRDAFCLGFDVGAKVVDIPTMAGTPRAFLVL